MRASCAKATRTEHDVRVIAGADVAFDKPNGRAVAAVVVLVVPVARGRRGGDGRGAGDVPVRARPALVPRDAAAARGVRAPPAHARPADGRRPRLRAPAALRLRLPHRPHPRPADDRRRQVAPDRRRRAPSPARAARAPTSPTTARSSARCCARARACGRSTFPSAIASVSPPPSAGCCTARRGYRVPEPTRRADRLAGEAKRRMLDATLDMIIEQRAGEPGRWEWMPERAGDRLPARAASRCPRTTAATPTIMNPGRRRPARRHAHRRSRSRSRRAPERARDRCAGAHATATTSSSPIPRPGARPPERLDRRDEASASGTGTCARRSRSRAGAAKDARSTSSAAAARPRRDARAARRREALGAGACRSSSARATSPAGTSMTCA